MSAARRLGGPRHGGGGVKRPRVRLRRAWFGYFFLFAAGLAIWLINAGIRL